MTPITTLIPGTKTFSACTSQALKLDNHTIPANDQQAPSAFISFKGRPEPSAGDVVAVFRNLNRPNFFSIRMKHGPYKNLVVGYAPAVCIADVDLIVQQGGRRRCVEKRVRNVHAWAQGAWVTCSEAPPLNFQNRAAKRYTYFPFVKPHFFERTRPQHPVTHLNRAWVTGADILAMD